MFFALSPDALSYGHPGVLTVLAASLMLFLLSAVARRIRSSLKGSMRGISKSWGPSIILMGIVGLILGVSEAEGIPFLAMPFLAVLWGVLTAAILLLHVFVYRRRSYTIIPQERVVDPRAEYLPKPKRR